MNLVPFCYPANSVGRFAQVCGGNHSVATRVRAPYVFTMATLPKEEVDRLDQQVREVVDPGALNAPDSKPLTSGESIPIKGTEEIKEKRGRRELNRPNSFRPFCPWVRVTFWEASRLEGRL